MKKGTDSRNAPDLTEPAATLHLAPSPPTRRETAEEAIARERTIPTLLDELGPETIAWIQREAAKHPEVLGRLPRDVKPKSGRSQGHCEHIRRSNEERN